MSDVYPEQFDVDTLAAMFGNQDDYGVKLDEYTDESLFPDGTPAVFCSNWAGYVRRVLGERAVIIGFDVSENPTSHIAVESEGHDFALVDGRFIVDVWAVDMDYLKVPVLDIEDPDNEVLITHLYGDRACWIVNEGFQAGIDGETPAFRKEYMEGVTIRLPSAAPAP